MDSNSPAYSRDRFKTWDISEFSHFVGRFFVHWSISLVSGTCDTRETVLKRDGTNVVTDSSCKATSGHWISPYDNVPTDNASDLDIVSLHGDDSSSGNADGTTSGSSRSSERSMNELVPSHILFDETDPWYDRHGYLVLGLGLMHKGKLLQTTWPVLNSWLWPITSMSRKV